MNETKQKGLLTELRCQTFFTELGYNVLIPLGEDCRYDMIVDIDNHLIRVQVKTSHLKDNEKGIEFSTRSTRVNSNNVISKKYTKDEIDYFATWWENKVYLIPVEECGVSKTLMFENKLVNQHSVSFINDYEAQNIIDNFILTNTSKEVKERKIYQYDLENNLIATWDSCHQAAIEGLGDVKKNSHISQAVNGQRKTAYGFFWSDKLIESKE